SKYKIKCETCLLSLHCRIRCFYIREYTPDQLAYWFQRRDLCLAYGTIW
ncbi:hypothetical protein DERP_008295, partial [Dermatophagoides pteronyssinus]